MKLFLKLSSKRCVKNDDRLELQRCHVVFSFWASRSDATLSQIFIPCRRNFARSLSTQFVKCVGKTGKMYKVMSIKRLIDKWKFFRSCQPGGPFHERFFHRNSNSMGNSFCCHPSYIVAIAIKFCTWHDNCTVVVCSNFCNGMIPCNGVTLKLIFHRNSFKNPSYITVIAMMKFCTWHDSCTVVPYAKCHSDIIPGSGDALKQIFHRMWNSM